MLKSNLLHEQPINELPVDIFAIDTDSKKSVGIYLLKTSIIFCVLLLITFLFCLRRLQTMPS